MKFLQNWVWILPKHVLPERKYTIHEIKLTMPLIISLFFGFVPMLVYAFAIYWLDHYEREPKILIGVVFFWGAIIAAGAAFLINTITGVGVYFLTGSESVAELTTGSIIAPIVEELLKGFAVLLVFMVVKKEFDSILDGIVYACVTAMGFAATENVYYIYVNGFLAEEFGGWNGLWMLVFIRVFLVGWQHPFYTSFFGIGLGIARLSKNTIWKVLAPLAGLGIAVFTHSFHNTVLPYLGGVLGVGGIVVGSLLDWSGWLAMLIFICVMVIRERNILKQYLVEEVNLGFISQSQYQTSYSVFRIGVATLKGLFACRMIKTRKFYRLCAELAHKKNQFHKLGDEGGNLKEIEKFRELLLEQSSLTPA